jgi:hypothetical protein
MMAVSTHDTTNLAVCQAGDLLSAVTRLISNAVHTAAIPEPSQGCRRTMTSTYTIAPYTAPSTPAHRAFTFIRAPVRSRVSPSGFASRRPYNATNARS